MSERPTIEPRDVSPQNTKLVLDAINGSTGPAQLAALIEIPDELDIGIRLAQRLLTRRDQLGGYTELQQIADVPLIGPKRFTDIVLALSPHGIPPTPLELLQQEVAALRAIIGSGLTGGAIARRRLTLRAVEPHVYLGQTASVVAALTDSDTPVVDAPVTLVATRGELFASDGYETHRGHLITARTGIDGTLRFNVRAKTSEEITLIQQDALLTQLARLDPEAPTPAAADKGLRAMAQQYAWEVNLPFRQAVDIFVRDFRPNLLDSINLDDPSAEWSSIDSAILAFAPAEGVGGEVSSVSATATLHMRALDWIAPFLESFVALTRKESSLGDELRDISKNTPDTGAMVNAIYERAGEYVASRWGRVGMYVGRKVAESSIRGFIDKDLAALPVNDRVALFPALDVASKTIATTDAGVIQGLVRTRQDIAKDVDDKITKRIPPNLGNLDVRVSAAEAKLALVPDRNELDALSRNLRAEITRATSDLDVKLGKLRTDVDAIQTRTGLLVTKAEMDAALATRVDIAKFDALSTSVDQRFATTNNRLNATDTRLTATDNRLDATDRKLTTVDQRFTAVDSRLSATDQRLTTVDRSITTINGKLSRIP